MAERRPAPARRRSRPAPVDAGAARRADRARRPHRRRRRAGAARVGAGRTVFEPHGQRARSLEAERRRGRDAVRQDRRVARTSDGGQTLALPGTLQGFAQSPIAARATGYLKRWTKDIGSRVAKGELLAEIETPEIDQQLSQARRRARADRGEPGAREEHGRALGGAAQEGRRLAAGARRAAQRPRAGDAPTSPPPTPTCSGCASCRASSASWRRSPA